MVQKIIFDKKRNKKERLWFIKYWANYVRTHKDEEWSKQQAVLINSQLQNSKRNIIRILKIKPKNINKPTKRINMSLYSI